MFGAMALVLGNKEIVFLAAFGLEFARISYKRKQLLT
jgi:hypothetical protein